MARARKELEDGLRSLAASLETEAISGHKELPLVQLPDAAPAYIANSIEIYHELGRQCTVLAEPVAHVATGN